MNKKIEKTENKTDLKKTDKKVSSFKKKKKVKKNVTSGVAYVYSTFNNTIISISDETALRSLQSRGFKILSIKDTTPMPHNGARPPKRRRV